MPSKNLHGVWRFPAPLVTETRTNKALTATRAAKQPLRTGFLRKRDRQWAKLGFVGLRVKFDTRLHLDSIHKIPLNFTVNMD